MKSEPYVNLSSYKNELGWKHQFTRLLWTIIWFIFARPLPRSMASRWKRFLLILFGAQIDKTARIYSTAQIYYPANLIMDEYSCLADNVNCYNVAPIYIGANTTVSQGSYLCTASHDIFDPHNRLITAPIIIEDQVWIAANAFIGMKVNIGQGAVIGARAVVTRDVEPWTVVVGNPAKVIKKRILKENA